MVFKPKYIQVCTINEALELHRGNKASLARELGLCRLTLRRYLASGGKQLCQVVTDENSISFKYINKN